MYAEGSIRWGGAGYYSGNWQYLPTPPPTINDPLLGPIGGNGQKIYTAMYGIDDEDGVVWVEFAPSLGCGNLGVFDPLDPQPIYPPPLDSLYALNPYVLDHCRAR